QGDDDADKHQPHSGRCANEVCEQERNECVHGGESIVPEREKNATAHA
ncbi:MAG: hypothetical protein RLZZ355_1496, partial [Pseudomonadota bacterium]